MQNQNETVKINTFLAMIFPLVLGIFDTILRSLSLEFEIRGAGLECVFLIKSKTKNSLEFHMHNLLLEIATQDRDQAPLVFDEKLSDFEYFTSKTADIINSKLTILLEVLGRDDVEAALDNICNMKHLYERIRIWKFDQKKSTQSQGP